MRTYTWDDYRAWPDDERWEIIGGEAYAMSPAPSVRHQVIQGNLFRALAAYFDGKPCRPLLAPLDVKLSDLTVLQPDIAVVCRKEQLKRTHIEGAPALVVEIVSESSALRDRTLKMRAYARHGIAEVWLVTPYPSVAEVFRLDGATYRLAGSYMRADTLKSPGFPKLRVKLEDVFDFPLDPDEKAAMAVREGPAPAYGTKQKRRGAKGKRCSRIPLRGVPDSERNR